MLSRSKYAETIKLSDKVIILEFMKEETDRFKKVKAKIMKTDMKVSEILNELDFMIEDNFFLIFYKLNIATTSDIEQIEVKLEPAL